jgi:phosphate transport system permease protein
MTATTTAPAPPPPTAGSLMGMRPSPRARIADKAATVLMLVAFLACVVPLVAVLFMVVKRGLARFDSTFFTHSMRNVAAQDPGGGAYHAIIGTIEQVAIASLLAVPLGLFVAVYLVEVGAGSRLATAVRYVVDVMTGLPSIVAGLFILSFWVLALHKNFSGGAGALSLAILMLPVVVRSAEEMLRLVPHELREAGYALGLAKWRITWRVVLPTALPGIVTGIMLAVARITGETAPLLLTIFGNDSINTNPFSGPQSALPLFVFDQAGRPNQTALDRAWAGALTLILIVVVLNLVARVLSRRNRLNP